MPLDSQVPPPEPFRIPPGPGRGGVILGLGIVALFLLGPVVGIPAWIMGQHDLRRIRKGEIVARQRPITQVGMILGIFGTFLVFLSILLGVVFSLSRAHAVQQTKEAMINEATTIASVAYRYRTRSSDSSGGGGSYQGFILPEDLKHSASGIYYVRIISADRLQIVGWSRKQHKNGLVAEVDSTGSVSSWIFSGDFEPGKPFFFKRRHPEEDETNKEVIRILGAGAGRVRPALAAGFSALS